MSLFGSMWVEHNFPFIYPPWGSLQVEILMLFTNDKTSVS